MIPTSLSSRIYSLALLVALALLVLAGLLYAANERSRAGFHSVRHTEEVLRTTSEMRAEIKEAESGQRSFVLTHSDSYLARFDEKVARAEQLAARLTALTHGNPRQNARARRLHVLVSTRVTMMRAPIALGRQGRFDAALEMISRGRGKAMMDQVTAGAAELMAEERGLLQMGLESAERLARWNRLLLLFGGPALAILFAGLVFHLVSSVRRPVRELLQAMSAFGSGALDARAPDRTGTREFDQLAASYNDMANRLAAALEQQRISDQHLHVANAELQKRGEKLAARGRSTELLAAMAHRMQACITDEELNTVLQNFLPRVFPDTSGALYAHNNSRNLLVKQNEWGNPTGMTEIFAPTDCWGLRRGQAHIVDVAGSDVVCTHLGPSSGIYRCEPVLAGGDVVGLLYLEGEIGEEEQFRLTVLVENIALSLVNHRLQRGLREQSIRDPLTNLFNRRYMEETLTIEVARSIRSGTNLGIVMCDVDHFKRFNDSFGHEAGDALLQAVGALIRSHFRDGDVACRYGGEEFAIVAPGANLAHLAARTERLRQDIAALTVQQQGRTLGDISMSFGIAAWTASEDADAAAILRAADGALYEAKAQGRNRVVIAGAVAKLSAAG